MRRNSNLCYIAFYNSPIKWYGVNSWSDPAERVENPELKEKFNRCFSYNLKSKMFGYSEGCLSPLIGKIGLYNKLAEESYYNRKKLFTTVRVPDYVDYMVPALTGGNIVNIDLITGQTWQDNNTDDGTLPGESSPGGCSIAKGKSTGSDIIIILAFLILVFKAVKYIGRKVW